MLSAEVMRAQVRSTIVDLLMLTGLTYDEARARIPASAALDDPDDAPDLPRRWRTTSAVVSGARLERARPVDRTGGCRARVPELAR